MAGAEDSGEVVRLCRCIGPVFWLRLPHQDRKKVRQEPSTLPIAIVIAGSGPNSDRA